jgi:hypothetical protein
MLRRDALRGIAQTVAAGAAIGGAGCSGGNEDQTTDGQTTDHQTTAAGSGGADAPQTVFGFDTDGGDVLIFVESGEAVSGGNLTVEGCQNEPFQAGENYSVGDTLTCTGGSDADTIQVHWTGGDEAVPMDQYEP